MIAVILVACGWAAMQGVNVLVNVNLEAKVKDLIANPLQIAKYIVYGDGTTYSLQNCTSGQYIYSSTNATTTISIAFGNLTSNRTCKEKVLLKGNFSVNTSIAPPSYSITELQGSIILAANANTNIFYLDNVNYVEIYGGSLTETGQTSP